MPPDPPTPLNPSQAVERIREIIVGRHLEKLEARVARLESRTMQEPLPASWEERLCTGEARLEALQQSVQRLSESTREEAEQLAQQQRAEIQRLAAQIQQVAAARAAESAQPAVDRLEQKLGAWLGNWQTSLQTHLNEREQHLAGQIRQEVATLWEHTESQITRLQSRALDRDQVEERFQRIAAAARALAECAVPTSTGPEPATP
jgi:predicted trehalose synthase